MRIDVDPNNKKDFIDKKDSQNLFDDCGDYKYLRARHIAVLCPLYFRNTGGLTVQRSLRLGDDSP